MCTAHSGTATAEKGDELRNRSPIRNARWKVAVGAALACILTVAGAAAAQTDGSRQNGFYLVEAEAPNVAALPRPNSEQQIVKYSNRFIRDSAPQPPRYLLLPRKADVVIELAREPELTTRGANGFPELRLELTVEAARALEELTRQHTGERIAFVIDGEPVTVHKIRSVITDGHFRLTRCTDAACQYIDSRLRTDQ